MGAVLMSEGTGSQRGRAWGPPGLLRRRWAPVWVLKPIVPVAYGWGQICGCPAGPKFSSLATRRRAMLGVACRRLALRLARRRAAPMRPAQSVLLSLAAPRRRRSATTIMEALPRLDDR